MGQQVTMEAVARLSGVSLATVSLVLRDKPGINSDTRRRVLEAARQLGYQRRYVTDSPRSNTITSIGLVMKSRPYDLPQVNQFYAPVIAGIESACRKQHVNLLYATLPVDDNNHPIEIPRLFSEPHADGVLLLGAFADDTITRVASEKSIPMVLVDAYAPNSHYDSVVSDNVQGAYEAVRHLIHHGHRHIGLVGSMANAYPSINDRRIGYLRALRDYDISTSYFGDSPLQMEEAYHAALTLLKRNPQITAIFGCNDETAIGTMRAARELGRRLPDDLSIIGFDDIDLATHVVPSLTTMRVDKVTMGRLAVQLLTHRVEYPEAATVTAQLRALLIDRGSVHSLKET